MARHKQRVRKPATTFRVMDNLHGPADKLFLICVGPAFQISRHQRGHIPHRDSCHHSVETCAVEIREHNYSDVLILEPPVGGAETGNRTLMADHGNSGRPDTIWKIIDLP